MAAAVAEEGQVAAVGAFPRLIERKHDAGRHWIGELPRDAGQLFQQVVVKEGLAAQSGVNRDDGRGHDLPDDEPQRRDANAKFGRPENCLSFFCRPGEAGHMEKRPFNELGLSDEILKAVDKMGFEEASPIQTAVIPDHLAGRDVVGQSSTGSGKTVAFAIPAIERWTRRCARCRC
jgi:hypothetical protein